MQKKTFEEIKAKLYEITEDSVDELAYETDGICKSFDEENPENPFFGKVKEIHQVGGEGEGEHWEVVYYFEYHDVYMKIEGCYYSHDGTHFDNDPFEVRPKEKTITVYE